MYIYIIFASAPGGHQIYIYIYIHIHIYTGHLKRLKTQVERRVDLFCNTCLTHE